MTRETRKIQKVGGSTFSVSLPKSWAQARGLSAGSLVAVYAHPEDTLVVDPAVEDDAAERTVTVAHDDSERLEYVVRAAYAAGLDQLRIEATETLTREQRRTVGRTTEELPGTAVVEEREDHVVVQVLLDGEEVSIRQSVRQLSFVAASMHREALGALAGETPPDAVDRDAEADRLFALVDRHFQRGLSRVATVDALDATRPELAALRATARELQRVAADAARLGEVAAELEASATAPGTAGSGATDASDAATDAAPTDAASTDTAPVDVGDEAPDPVALGERACAVVETATEAVLADEGVDGARSALVAHAALAEDLADAERALREGDDYRLHRAIEHCRRTADRGAAVARLGLRGSLRRDEVARSPPADDLPAIAGSSDDGTVAPSGNGVLGESADDAALGESAADAPMDESADDAAIGGTVPAGGEPTGTLDPLDGEPAEDGAAPEHVGGAADADGPDVAPDDPEVEPEDE